MSTIFLLITEHEFVPDYNLAPTGIALRCQFSMYSKSVAKPNRSAVGMQRRRLGGGGDEREARQ